MSDLTSTTQLASDISLLDFWAPWCGPCRTLTPVIDQLQAEYAGRVNVSKVNVDENTELSSSFGVKSIPHVVITKGGKVVAQFIGANPIETYKKALDRALAG